MVRIVNGQVVNSAAVQKRRAEEVHGETFTALPWFLIDSQLSWQERLRKAKKGWSMLKLSQLLSGPKGLLILLLDFFGRWHPQSTSRTLFFLVENCRLMQDALRLLTCSFRLFRFSCFSSRPCSSHRKAWCCEQECSFGFCIGRFYLELPAGGSKRVEGKPRVKTMNPGEDLESVNEMQTKKTKFSHVLISVFILFIVFLRRVIKHKLLPAIRWRRRLRRMDHNPLLKTAIEILTTEVKEDRSDVWSDRLRLKQLRS